MSGVEELTLTTQQVTLPGAGTTISASDPFLEWWSKPSGEPVPENLGLEEWGKWLHRMRSGKTKFDWKLVDLLLHAENKWGETYHQIAERSGFSKDTLHVYASVGAATKLMRHKDLPFSFHQAVARFDPESQRLLLDRVEQDRMGREEFRAMVKEFGKNLSEPEPQWSNGEKFGAVADKDMNMQEWREKGAKPMIQKLRENRGAGDDPDVFNQPDPAVEKVLAENPLNEFCEATDVRLTVEQMADLEWLIEAREASGRGCTKQDYIGSALAYAKREILRRREARK